MPMTWDDPKVVRRPLTVWDKVAGLLLLWSFGVLCGAVAAMWIGQHLRG